MAKNQRPYVRPKNIPAAARPRPGKPSAAQSAQSRNEVKNPRLCSAMDTFKQDPNTATQNAFVEELFRARLLLPCHTEKREGAGLNEQIQIKFLLLKNKEGENILGAFTDWGQIRKQQNTPPAEAAAMPFNELLRIATDQGDKIKGIIINPFEHGILLDRNTIKNMSENLDRILKQNAEQNNGQNAGQNTSGETVSEGAKSPADENTAADEPLSPEKSLEAEMEEKKGEILYIGEPPEDPYDLLKELGRYYNSVKAVTAAYFLEIHRAGIEKASPLVVIDFKGDSDTKVKVYDETKKICAEHLGDASEISVMTAGEKLVKDTVVNIKPFYTRRLFGIF